MGNFKNRLTATGPRSCLAHKSLTSTWVEKRAPLALTLHLPCTYPALHREGGGHGTVSHAGAKKGGPEACLGGGDTAPSVMQAQKRVGPPPLPCTRPTYPALAPQACLGGGTRHRQSPRRKKGWARRPYPALTLHLPCTTRGDGTSVTKARVGKRRIRAQVGTRSAPSDGGGTDKVSHQGAGGNKRSPSTKSASPAPLLPCTGPPERGLFLASPFQLSRSPTGPADDFRRRTGPSCWEI